MKSLLQVILMHVLIVLTVRLTEGRDLRDISGEEPLLLSALCIQDGQLREACLQDVSTVSIQKFLDTLLEKIRDNNRYSDILRQLNINNDDVMETDDVMPPQKRGRSRNGNVSGFYSNW